MIKYLFLTLFLACFSAHSIAQSFRINEVMSSNGGVVTDLDGDTPDWIEFYNAGTTPLNLNGYGLSDKKDEPFQWVFPEKVINPGEYLVVFASEKDRREPPVNWNTLISSGDTWKYLVPTTEPVSIWRTSSFSDSNWISGKSGFGYGDNDDATVVTVSKSIFLRKKFTITDIASIRQMALHMDYDDGFVAYLNGMEIARAQMDGKGAFPRFDATSSGLHEALIYQKFTPEKFLINNPASYLKTGENILAIQVHNSEPGSSDFSAIPFLSVETNVKAENPRVIDVLKLDKSELHTNFKMSADGESLYLTDPSSVLTDSIRVAVVPSNASYGRTIKNPAVWAIFTTSTPEKENLGEAFSEENVGVPVFSLPAGIYPSALKVSLTAPNRNDTIYYTLNGSEPTRSSSRVIREVSIPISKVLKARILKSGAIPGKTVTNSYIIYDNQELPVVSISMDSLVLFDKVTGMYMLGPNADSNNPYFGANFWQDWEKACHLEMLESTGNKVIDLDAGVKIFGNYSRANAQKSLVIHSRKSYSADQIKYKLFEDRPFDEYKNIVLRNSGNDWNLTMFRDGLMSCLSTDLDFEKMAYRPSIIFLNGRYWGIQNIREKIDEHFIASNRGVNPDEVIMLQNNGEVMNGTADDWKKVVLYVENNSLVTTANYEQLASLIDIESFIDYYAAQIFFRNHDWPGNNIKFWKTTDPASRWRWIMFDTDFGMGLSNSSSAENSLAFATEPNGPGWPNPPWSTLFLRKLLENSEFRNQFVTRFEDLLNSTFLPDRLAKAINEKSGRINDEIANHLKRWYGQSKSVWLANVQGMRVFAAARPNYMFSHIQQKFGFQAKQLITVSTDSLAGSIQLNSLKLNKFPWKGSYIPNVPVTLTAIPKAGYRFLKWEGVTTGSSSQVITVSPKANLLLTAIFESDGSHYEDIVINEISFNNDAEPDPGDWVEIYNKGQQDIDLSGWKLTDSDSTHQYVFAPNTWIKANEYLVVSNDLIQMVAVFGSVKNQLGPFEFGLGNKTDAVKLYSSASELIDEVSYSNVVPWQPFDLTESWSLELTNPAKDNNSGLNWVRSEKYGTPGSRNTPYILNEIDDQPLSENSTVLSTNYPNPFSEGTYFEFELDRPGKYRISVLDVNGRMIRNFYGDNQLSTIHSLYWDGRDDSGNPVASGVYFYRLDCDGFSENETNGEDVEGVKVAL